jgi:hypothetical protein
MTGQCYYCAAGEHHECESLQCTCCGERNREFARKVNRMERQLRIILTNRRGMPITALKEDK